MVNMKGVGCRLCSVPAMYFHMPSSHCLLMIMGNAVCLSVVEALRCSVKQGAGNGMHSDMDICYLVLVASELS